GKEEPNTTSAKNKQDVTASGSATASTTSDAPTKDSTNVEVYPKTGENIGTSLFLRSLGLVISAIVAVAVLGRKLLAKK
ncbi:hypothetical protein NGA70_13315, partial [Enterococcus faecalis]